MTAPPPYGDTAHLLAERVACMRDGCRVCAGVDDWLRAEHPRAWLNSLPAPTPGSHESDLWNRGVHPAPNWPPDTFWRECDEAAWWSRNNRMETTAQ